MSSHPRFRQLELKELDDAQAKVAEKIVKFAGGIPGPFNVLLRSPGLADVAFDFGAYLLNESPVPRRLKEMVVLMRARFSNCDYEWHPHERFAREAGLDGAVIEAIKRGRRPAHMGHDEQALYEFVAGLLTRGYVDDTLFDAARAVFGEAGLADITALVGFYGMVAGIIAVADLPRDPDAAPLEPVADAFQDPA